MTGSRRMQGIIIFAPLRAQYAHWFAQRRIGLSHRSTPQGTEHKNQAAALCDLCDLRWQGLAALQILVCQACRSIMGFPNPRIAHGGAALSSYGSSRSKRNKDLSFQSRWHAVWIYER
jgi:hypothetical protein